MRSHAGTPPSRRRFLALVAGGAGIGTAVLNGCAVQVSSGVSGPGETVTLLVKPDDLVIAFTWTWGDYIAPQPLLSTDRSTLAVAVMSTYINAAGTPVTNLQAAASVMYVVPILLVFLVAQRGFVAGMATSGLK